MYVYTLYNSNNNNDNDNMYQPGETQNQKCINLTERRSTEREA